MSEAISSFMLVIYFFLEKLRCYNQKPSSHRSSSVIFIISLKNEDNMQYGNVTGKLYKYIECCLLCDKR